MEKKSNRQKPPDISTFPNDLVLELPADLLKPKHASGMWGWACFTQSIFQMFFDYHYKYASKVATGLEPFLQPHEQFTEEQQKRHAVSMSVLALQYIDNQIDQAVSDAIELVITEALDHTLKHAANIWGAREATHRVVLPSRGDIEEKALKLLRRRYEGVEFRGPGRLDEWTPLQLRLEILKAMRQIINIKNRTKGRVAAIFYKKDYEQLPASERKSLTVSLNDLMKDKVDYKELEREDDARRAGEGKVN
jgi:hypothetical protein